MKRVLFPLLALLSVFCLQGAEFDRVFAPGIVITAAYPVPRETRGLYYPGEAIVQHAAVRNDTKKEAALILDAEVKDIFGKVMERKRFSGTCAPGKQHLFVLKFAPAKKFGYYTVELTVSAGGKKYARRQSAFALLPPWGEGRRDPFFGFNQSTGFVGPEGLKRTGFGTFEFGLHAGRYLDAYSWIYSLPYVRGKNIDGFIDFFEHNRDPRKMREAGFKVMGMLGQGISKRKEIARRIKENLAPADDIEYRTAGEMAEAAARRYKGIIKLWCLVQEVDAQSMVPSPACGGALPQLADFMIRCRQAAAGVRRGNPDAKLLLMPSMGFDWSINKPPFLYTRMLMKDLGNDFDYFGVDVYVNAGDARRGRLIPPETGDLFRKIFRDGAALSKEMNRPELLFNSERGYGALYFDDFLSDTNMKQGNYTARSMILARSTNVCPYFSVFTGGGTATADRDRRKLLKPGEVITDYGLSKGILGETGKYPDYPMIPRPGMALVSIAARELAFVKNAALTQLGDELYLCRFDAPRNQQLVALWSSRIFSGVNSKVFLDLPAGGVLDDGWGNKTVLEPGKQTILLTETPKYLRLGLSRAQTEALIAKAAFELDAPFRAVGRRLDRRTLRFEFSNPSGKALRGVLRYGKKSLPLELAPGLSARLLDSGEKLAAAALELPGRAPVAFTVDNSCVEVPRLRTSPKFDGGNWFGQAAEAVLKPQESVFPERARMGEAGFFKMDGSDVPVKLYYAWDDRFLYVGARVPEKKHLQRYTGMGIWQDDSFQIALTPREDFVSSAVAVSSKRNDFGPREHNIGAALTKEGVQVCDYKRKALADFPAKVTLKTNETVYELALPLKEMGLTPRSGTRFGAAAVVFCNDSSSNKYAPYYFCHGRGVAGGQDISKFIRFIFK